MQQQRRTQCTSSDTVASSPLKGKETIIYDLHEEEIQGRFKGLRLRERRLINEIKERETKEQASLHGDILNSGDNGNLIENASPNVHDTTLSGADTGISRLGLLEKRLNEIKEIETKEQASLHVTTLSGGDTGILTQKI